MIDQIEMDYVLQIALPVLRAEHNWAVIWIPIEGHDLVKVTSTLWSIRVEQERDLNKFAWYIKDLAS